MALNNLGLGIVFTATDLASSVIRSVSSSILGLDSTVGSASKSMAAKLGVATDVMKASLKGLGAGLAVAAVGFGGLVAAFSLAKPAGEFEQGLAAVGAVTRATTADLKLLRATAIQAGIETQFSPQEAVEGLKSLATAGQTAKQATQTLIPVLDLAAGSLGQLGVAGAADAVIGTLNAYQLTADQATSVTDKLLRVTQATNFQARDFEAGLAKAAATGAVFGQSLDDVLVSLGLLRNRNIDASSSATAFREAVRQLGSDQRSQAAVTELGVAIFDRQTGKMRSIIDVIQDFSQATRNLTDEERNRRIEQAFGARGLLAYNAIAMAQATVTRDGKEVVLQGAEAIAELRKQMSTAEGTAASFREAMLDTFEGQKTLLVGTIQTIAVAIGEPFAKVLKPIVGAVVKTLNFLLAGFLLIPDSIKTGFAAFLVAGSATAIVVGLGIAINALIPILGALASAAVAAVSPLLPVIIPVVAAIVAATAAVYALKLAWDANLGGIQQVVLPIFEKISLAFRSLVALFSEGEISGQLAEDLTSAENAGVFSFVQTVSRAVAQVEAFFRGAFATAGKMFDRLQKAFTPVFKRLGAIFDEVFGLMAKTFAQVSEALGLDGAEQGVMTMEGIGAVITEIAAGPLVSFIEGVAVLIEGLLMVVQVVVRIGAIVSNTFGSFFEVIGGAFNTVMALINGDMNQLANGITSMINGIVDFINDTLIESAASVAAAIGMTTVAEGLRAMKMPRFEAEPLAMALGGSDANAMPQTAFVSGPTQATEISGPNAVSIGAPTAGGVGARAGGLIPESGGASQAGGGLGRDDIAALLAALPAGAERGPIIVQGEVMLNGRAVGEMQAQDERDREARNGRLQTAHGR